MNRYSNHHDTAKAPKTGFEPANTQLERLVTLPFVHSGKRRDDTNPCGYYIVFNRQPISFRLAGGQVALYLRLPTLPLSLETYYGVLRTPYGIRTRILPVESRVRCPITLTEHTSPSPTKEMVPQCTRAPDGIRTRPCTLTGYRATPIHYRGFYLHHLKSCRTHSFCELRVRKFLGVLWCFYITSEHIVCQLTCVLVSDLLHLNIHVIQHVHHVVLRSL